MKLHCHAILKSGARCNAIASTVVNGSPSCDRPKHYYGRAKFVAMTPESVGYHDFISALIWVDFLGGKSIAEIASVHKLSAGQVEDQLREAARLS
jgi:hypothetical protein